MKCIGEGRLLTQKRCLAPNSSAGDLQRLRRKNVDAIWDKFDSGFLQPPEELSLGNFKIETFVHATCSDSSPN